MTAQQLRNSILKWAIQGRLVEQRAEEGTAKELTEQIKAEKEQLVKDKEIKKEKPLPEITEDEIPFDIPESWEWMRFGDIMINRDAERIPLSVAQREHLEKKYDYYGASGVIDQVDNYIFDKELLLIGEDGANLLTRSKPIAFIAKGKYWVNNHAHVIDCGKYIHLEYIMYYINAISLAKYVTGTAQPKMNQAKMNGIVVPLPPLEEQKRIVAKIEELMPYVEQYDQAYTKLEAFNKKFPEDMQKSILQYAIQGKLVEQRAAEGTAEDLYQQIQEEKERLIKEKKIKKEKPLPEITEDEIPFDIPESWKWVRLGSLCEKIGSGSTPTGGKAVYKESGIKFLRSQNVYNDGLRIDEVAYISEEQNKLGSIVKPKDILLNITGGSIGRCALVPDDFDVANINQHVMIIRNISLDNRFFLHQVLISPYIQTMIMSVQVGVSREGLSAEKLRN
ncbi:MAG: restriction endonuclease subunit S, partial [Niameybacter sp.]